MNYFNKLNGNKTAVPEAVLRQCMWIMKDYDRLSELVGTCEQVPSAESEIVFYADDNAGLKPQSVVDEAKAKMQAIERALGELPEEYRLAIFEYYAHGVELPDEASNNTWKKWRRTFIRLLARELNIY